MPQIEIIRYRDKSDAVGTYGELHLGDFFCYTVEQPWNGNAQGHSCFPAGEYELVPYDSLSHGETVIFRNPALNLYGPHDMVPAGGRSYCEIHNANWPFQVKGCVAVGAALTDIPPHGLGVTSSVDTFERLRKAWGNRESLTALVRWDK